MQIIDLTKPGDNYKVITFPDGEVHLEIAELNRKESVNVRCRITNATELFVLMQLGDILKRQCVEIGTLEILYLMSMRCDRVFSLSRPFSLGIVANVIDSIGAKKVRIYEPHSLRSLSCINHARKIYTSQIIARELYDADNGLLFVAPDEGATLRYDGVPFSVVCSKHREESTGRLLGFKAEATISVKGRRLLMVDDLCDGGGTFVGLAPKIRELEPESLSLVVTHAIQLDGIKRVAEAYDKVYIANTYKEWREVELPSNVEVFDVTQF